MLIKDISYLSFFIGKLAELFFENLMKLITVNVKLSEIDNGIRLKQKFVFSGSENCR